MTDPNRENRERGLEEGPEAAAGVSRDIGALNDVVFAAGADVRGALAERLDPDPEDPDYFRPTVVVLPPGPVLDYARKVLPLMGEDGEAFDRYMDESDRIHGELLGGKSANDVHDRWDELMADGGMDSLYEEPFDEASSQ